VLTAAFWNANVRDNSNELAPFFSAWTAYTPSITNISVGNGTHNSRYLKIGRLVIVHIVFTFGSTTTISGPPRFTLPFTASGFILHTQAGFVDAGVGGFVAFPEPDRTNEIVLNAVATSGAYASQAGTSATVPFTWTTGDMILVGGIYNSAT
jgi:hypothetical protein